MIYSDVVDLRDITDENEQRIICDAMGWDIADYDMHAENEPTLIADDYFVYYAKELAEECGMVKEGATWPNNCIDWEKAASALQDDYLCFDIEGKRYWIRDC
jgi:hypothetical protein